MSKYAEAVERIRNRQDATELFIQCEKLEKSLGVNPAAVLYSEKKEDIISYNQYVLEIENEADDFLFSLAGHKGETIETLKRKSVSDIMSFAERVADGRY